MKLANLNHDFEKNLQRITIIKKILNDPTNNDFEVPELLKDGFQSIHNLSEIWNEIEKIYLLELNR